MRGRKTAVSRQGFCLSLGEPARKREGVSRSSNNKRVLASRTLVMSTTQVVWRQKDEGLVHIRARFAHDGLSPATNLILT